MNVCTFAGHSVICAAGIERKLDEEIEKYLADVDEAIFYLGGRGEFDSMAAAAVRVAKKRHRDKKIQLYLVEPYMREGINRDRAY